MTLGLTLGAVGDVDAGTDIAAATATVSLLDAAKRDVGTLANPIQTSVDSLNVDTSAGNGDQYLTEANALTQLNLRAGTGSVTLAVTLGAVGDVDAATDIAAATATVTLLDAVKRDVGTLLNPIQTSVDSLNVDTSAGNGDQYLTEANGLAQLNLRAGTGSITLAVTLGAVGDVDAGTDIAAATATVSLLDAVKRDVGTLLNPIQTSVDSLNVDTSAGNGDQYLTEANGLAQLNLRAGTGSVTLVLTLGAVGDVDAGTDIAAATATVTLLDAVKRDVGTLLNPIQTSVDSLNVDTSAGNGDQYLREANGLAQLNLRAGTGSVTLVLTLGAVGDVDAGTDIAAATATVTLLDAVKRDVGTLANPIQTSVDSLNVDTSAGNGDQYLTEANGLAQLNLRAGTGSVTLGLTLGAVGDVDAGTDIAAATATVTLLDAVKRDVGTLANPIQTSVDSLNVDTSAGNGDQYLTEANGLAQLNLRAGTGSVTLVLTLGAVGDVDAGTDIAAATATVTLLDAVKRDVGTLLNPIQTSVDSLNVDTSAGNGDQYLREANGLAQLNLRAGTGSVTLVLTLGAVGDVDAGTDIAAATATVTLLDAVKRDVGTLLNPIQTSVDSLNVDTSAGNGDQYLTEANGLAQLNLRAGTGSITLAVTLGAVGDVDAGTDIAASNLVMSAPAGIGTAVHPIQTAVGKLEADGGSGGVYVTNTGALAIGGISAMVGVSATGGNIAITASSPLTVNEDVIDSGGGDIALTATNDGSNDDHLTINARVVASGGNGSIALHAGTDLIVNHSTSPEVSAAGTGTITAVADRDVKINADVTIQSAQGAVSLTADNLSGNHGGKITMDDKALIDAGSGAIGLAADGDITLGGLKTTNSTTTAVTLSSTSAGIVDGGDTYVDVVAASGGVSMTAGTAIGASGPSGQIDTTIGSLTATANNGGVYIGETDGLTLTSVTAKGAGNDVEVTSTTGDIGVGVVTAPDVVKLTATAGSIADDVNDDLADVIGSTATLTASTGIGQGSNGSVDLNVNTLSSAITVTGGIALNLLNDAADGLPADHAVTVTNVRKTDATTSADVVLTATTGAGPRTYSQIDNEKGNISVTGGSGNDMLTVDLIAEHWPTKGGLLTFDGGGGDDTLVIDGTNADDVFCINDVTGVIKWQGNELIDYQSVENLRLNTRDGDDQVGFQMSTNPTTVYVDGGSDSGNVDGLQDGFKIVGTDGDDRIVVGDYNDDAPATYAVPAHVLGHLPRGFCCLPQYRNDSRRSNTESLQVFGGSVNDTGNDVIVNDLKNPFVSSLQNGGAREQHLGRWGQGQRTIRWKRTRQLVRRGRRRLPLSRSRVPET